MTGNVIELTQEVIDDFRERKILREQSSEIELEAVAGLRVLSDLTPPEIEIYTEIVILEDGLEDWSRELAARSAEAVARVTRNKEVSSAHDFASVLANEKVFEDRNEAEEYFQEVARFEYLRGLFWYSLRERLQNYSDRLSIRAGWVVCCIGSKYQQ